MRGMKAHLAWHSVYGLSIDHVHVHIGRCKDVMADLVLGDAAQHCCDEVLHILCRSYHVVREADVMSTKAGLCWVCAITHFE